LLQDTSVLCTTLLDPETPNKRSEPTL